MDRHHWPTIAKSIDPLMSYFELQGRFRDGLDIARDILVRLNELVGMQQPYISITTSWAGMVGSRSA